MSVKNELKSLRRKIQRRTTLATAEQVEAYRLAFLDRLVRRRVGEDVSNYPMPPCPLPASMVAGARERLVNRLLAIVERRERAETRSVGGDLEQEHATVSKFVAKRMRELDKVGRGAHSTTAKQIEETGNPMIERLRSRRFQFQEEDEDK